jgi:hypothetical protein
MDDNDALKKQAVKFTIPPTSTRYSHSSRDHER